MRTVLATDGSPNAELATDFPRPTGRVAAVESSTVVGDPASEITALATKRGSGLVVVGARGLGTLERLLLASVSERVVRERSCAVLILKSPTAVPARS